jgi:hypothetical protein
MLLALIINRDYLMPGKLRRSEGEILLHEYLYGEIIIPYAHSTR